MREELMLADTILTNGVICAVGSHTRMAECVAVRDGAILFVGSAAVAKKFTSVKTRVIDLKGRLVLPGFADAHAHIHEAVDRLYAADLYGLFDQAAYVRAVTEFASTHPDFPVLMGKGWSEALFPGIGPLKEWLDAVVSDRPVALWSDSW
jgi:predicted amidohydrolase YtcJ